MAYCQLIDTVLLQDKQVQQLNSILLEVDSKYGDETAHKVKMLYQINLEKDAPNSHVEVCVAVYTELLREFTISKLLMGIYFTTKYLALVQDLEHPSEDELVILRKRLSDELKSIIKDISDHPTRPWRPSWSTCLVIAGGLLSYFAYKVLQERL